VLFEKRVAEVQEHNAVPGRLWTKGINKLADRTARELKALRGYRHQASKSPGTAPPQRPFGLVEGRTPSVAGLPTDFSWQSKLQATTEIEDQGGCGSCWAFAASTVLRAHSELFQTDRRFSQQQIVACTPNPKQCGGEGGCKGATIELAMNYVSKNGCVTAKELPYAETDDTCPTSMIDLGGSSKIHDNGGLRLGMTGFQKLPENELMPLLLALTEQGPVGVSLATSSGWNSYDRGIMDGCQPDALIDHAVTLVGYGQDDGVKYWQIQNSWGKDWGEGGFVRLARHDNQKEATYCGIDTKPEIGSGCLGGPSKVRVCGTCGILYDTVVPTFELSSTGWWSTTGNRTPSLLEHNVTRPRRLLRAHTASQ
jgi:cathepsin L